MITKNSTGANISAGFVAASTATKRRSRARVDFIWTDSFVDSFLKVESYDKNYGILIAEINEANPLMQIADGKLEPTNKYIILDGTWELGDDKVLAPCTTEELNSFQMGWYSDSVTDEDGNFTYLPFPTLDVNFDPAGRAVTNILVVGDTLLNQYPVNFTVKIFDSEDDELYSESVTNNTSVQWSKSIFGVLGAVWMRLEISKWSAGNTVAKIVEFFSAESDSFGGDEIITMDLLEEREAKKGTSPVGNVSLNELTLKLQNIKITASDGVTYTNPFSYGNSENNRFYSFLKPNRRIIAYLGFMVGSTDELVKVGTFWTTGDWRANDLDLSATVTAYDRLSLLKSHTFECPEVGEDFENTNLKDLAELVLNHAKNNIPMTDLTWDIGSDLESFTVPIAWFGKGSYYDAIKAIAEACLGQAWMSKDDVLMIRSYLSNADDATDLQITRDDYFDKNQPSNINELKNYVEVAVQSISKSSTKEDVYSEDKVYTIPPVSSDTIEINYNGAPASGATASLIDITAGAPAIDESQSYYFSYGCRIVISNHSGDAAAFKIKVQAYTYDLNSNVIAFAKNTSSITEYGEKKEKIDNHLIQSKALAQTVADTAVANFSVDRRDASLNWRGDPRLEVGDIVEVPEYGENTARFVVIKNDWSFDGGLKVNTLARKVAS